MAGMTATIPTQLIVDGEQTDDPAALNTTQHLGSEISSTVLDTSQDSEITRTLQALQEAQKNLRSASKDDPRLASKILAVANCQGDYVSATGTKDEGTIIEALELAATAEGMSPWSEYTHGAAAYAQMMICYVAHDLFDDQEWLLRGIDFGKDSASVLSDNQAGWVDASGMSKYRKIYSGRCEQVAEGYKMLYKHNKNWKTMTAALDWQRRATDWTDPLQDVEGGAGEWDKKLERYSEWLRMWLQAMDRNPNVLLLEPINLINHLYPQNLRGPTAHARAYWIGYQLTCRHWALTRNPLSFNEVLRRAREIMAWNSETKAYGSRLDNKWCQDPENQLHVLRVASFAFNEYYSMWNEGSASYNDLATIKTSIALLEELYRRYKQKTLTGAGVEEVSGIITELRFLCRGKYRLTNAVADGWLLDDIHFEESTIALWLKVLRSNESLLPNTSVESLFQEQDYSFVTRGTSIITQQGFVAYAREGQIELNWTSLRFKFLQDTEEASKPPAAENWISGRTGDGQWVIGAPIEGRDEDVLEFIRTYKEAETEGRGFDTG